MENNKTNKTAAFLRSPDFMRLGQAINHGQWQSAFLTLRRMEQQADSAGLHTFERPFAGLKYALQRKDVMEAKQILSVVVTKRVQLLKQLEENDSMRYSANSGVE